MELNRVRDNPVNSDFMKVILDTNFLTIPGEKKIDIFKRIKDKEPKAEFITLKAVEEELEKIGTKGSEVGKQLLKKKNIKIIDQKEEKHTDDKIIELAEKENAKVATNDKELRKRCREKNIQVIYLRSHKKIQIE